MHGKHKHYAPYPVFERDCPHNKILKCMLPLMYAYLLIYAYISCLYIFIITSRMYVFSACTNSRFLYLYMITCLYKLLLFSICINSTIPKNDIYLFIAIAKLIFA